MLCLLIERCLWLKIYWKHCRVDVLYYANVKVLRLVLHFIAAFFQITDDSLRAIFADLMRHFHTSRGMPPTHIFVIRDGVSEGQYKYVIFCTSCLFNVGRAKSIIFSGYQLPTQCLAFPCRSWILKLVSWKRHVSWLGARISARISLTLCLPKCTACASTGRLAFAFLLKWMVALVTPFMHWGGSHLKLSNFMLL